MNVQHNKGNMGEHAVKQYLIKNECCILAENYRIKGGEIDLIASKGEEILFVEVKTRGIRGIETGYEAVNKRKMANIVRTAMRYCTENNTDLQPRFDVAVVCMEDGYAADIDYIENAFNLSDCDIIF